MRYTDQVTIAKNFLQAPICSLLANWLESEQALGHMGIWANGYFLGGCRTEDPNDTEFLPVEEDPTQILFPLQNIPKEFFEVERMIQSHMNIPQRKYKKAVALGSVIYPGGFVTPHIDNNPYGEAQLIRCNVLLQESEGGEFVVEINGKQSEFKLEQGDLLHFPADSILHWTKPVRGNKTRILISYPILAVQPAPRILLL